MKKYSVLSVAVVVVLAVLFAGHLYAKECSQQKKGEHGFNLEKKVLEKMHGALSNKEALGLSDDQYQEIKALKIAVKKDLIRSKAEVDIVTIDMKSMLSESPIDVAGVNKLIDQKYELKKARAKALVDVCAKFKGVLTDEQQKKLKSLCSKKQSSCPGMKNRHHKMKTMCPKSN